MLKLRLDQHLQLSMELQYGQLLDYLSVWAVGNLFPPHSNLKNWCKLKKAGATDASIPNREAPHILDIVTWSAFILPPWRFNHGTGESKRDSSSKQVLTNSCRSWIWWYCPTKKVKDMSSALVEMICLNGINYFGVLLTPRYSSF